MNDKKTSGVVCFAVNYPGESIKNYSLKRYSDTIREEDLLAEKEQKEEPYDPNEHTIRRRIKDLKSLGQNPFRK